MIDVVEVSKSYGRTTVLENISFQIKEGEKFILLGTSGSGKTTLLKLLNRLIEPSGGAIRINGMDIRNQPQEKLRRGMGYVLQRNSLFPHYTVEENISVVPKLLDQDKESTRARIKVLMEKLHLSEKYLSKYPNSLSGGEAQRVNLARAIISNPPILLLDEPFSSLDTITRNAIRKEFSSLTELIGKTVVLVTHDIQEAFELGDKICLVDKGRIKQIGTPRELLYNPSDEFVRNFLSEAFLQLSLKVTTLKDIWQHIQNQEKTDDVLFVYISSICSVSTAMEKILDKNDRRTRLMIENEETRDFKQVNWENLITAFSRYKN